MNPSSTLVPCRVCGNPLSSVLTLGDLYPSAWLSDDDPLPPKAPLELAECSVCGLVQLGQNVDLDSLYRDYHYQSGINPQMVSALKNVVDEAVKLVDLQLADAVCDIASNDGTLLSFYPENVIRVGFDPARNLPRKAVFDIFVNDYFSADTWPLALHSARIVTSIAVFYDLPDPKQFVRDVKAILAEDGIWIIQINDLRSMLETNSVDYLVHEHVECYSVWDILRLTAQEGLWVFRIEHNDVNAGSLRFYVSFAGTRAIEESVMAFMTSDRMYLSSPEGSIHAFASRVQHARRVLVNWLMERDPNGQLVCGIAASTKGNTLLQYFGINSDLLPVIGDLNPDKIGKHTVGTNIPILSETHVLECHPDYLLILAWHFLDSFLIKFRDYMAEGGALVVPLPEPRMFRMDGDGIIRSGLLEKSS